MNEDLDLPPTPSTTSWRGLLAAPISRHTWRAWSFGAVSVFTATVAFTLVVTFVAVAAGLSLIVAGLPLLAATLGMTGAFARVERMRLRAELDVRVPDPTLRPAPADARLTDRVRTVITDRRRWSQVLYFVASLGLMIVFVLSLALAAVAIAAIAYPLYRHVGSLDLPAPAVAGIWFGGVALLFGAPMLGQHTARWQVRAAHALLGPDPERMEADSRIDHLVETRSGVIDAADAERRRIERDLHDGAQQRLVALGVELGMAKRNAQDPAARSAIDHAHGEVKEALAELRDLVRGIHPAILTDRGFDAALSALAARCPVPVSVSVDGAQQLEELPETTKSAAYFVAAEALTNVAKHARASTVSLCAQPLAKGAPGLVLTIADDGIGGATCADDGGLAGLRGRVAALDGTLEISSPPGGGTRLAATIPAGASS